MSMEWLDGLGMADAASIATPTPSRPVNWNALSADEAEAAWAALDEWVLWLRRTYGLPAAVLPPFWHRHAELLWELSALHSHWLSSYDETQSGSAPLAWHQDFAHSQQRLREWVAASSTRLDRDRPTRQTVWPGESAAESAQDRVIADRHEDFASFVRNDVARRRALENGTS